MSPTEKARELIHAFCPYCTYDKEGLVTPVAKQAASIAAEQILSLAGLPQFQIVFWRKVKERINKL